MFNFRENWEINLAISDTIPRFKRWLFVTPVKLKVPFGRHS